ncbi:MAG: L,D-transpeptidase [Clostridiales Family XIII bacterium]|jgi:hypothetical protein|nr:L,D-transpeptidase [Clostridiales Family XIII bacterium]
MTILKKYKILFIIAVCVIGAICAYLVYAHGHYADRVPPGTYLAGEDVSGFTESEARLAGQKIYDSIVMDLTLRNESGVASVPAITQTLTVDDIGIRFEADMTAQAAINAASNEWFITRVNPFVKKFIGLSVIVDDEVITKKITSYFGDALFKSKLPKVKYSKKGKTFNVTPGVVGTTLDMNRFIMEVKAGTFRAGTSQYDVYLNPLHPEISDEAADEARDLANRAIKTKISFEKNDQVAYKAGTNSKASWVTFTADKETGKYEVGIDTDKVMKFLKTTASSQLVEEPLPELVVREIDMESAVKEANEKAKQDSEKDKEEEKDKKTSNKKSDQDKDVKSTSKEDDGKSTRNDGSDDAPAKDVKVTTPAPKAARVVREGEEGFAISNRQQLADRIEESMLSGKNIKLTPEYETIPYETEEIGPDFGKWIETNLSKQVTYLWEGNKKIKTYIVSTGKNVTPTITGTYKIYMKRDHHDMKGYDPIKKEKYVQPDVRYISYFEGAYAYHAAYWHNAFGTQVSHGCINMKIAEAQFLYDWAPTGTTCIIHY